MNLGFNLRLVDVNLFFIYDTSFLSDRVDENIVLSF